MVSEPPVPPPVHLTEGQVIDGFVVEEKLHQGGMATIWRVRRDNAQPGDGLPLVMKVPRIKGGEDPASIVGFEVEQMILPALSAQERQGVVAAHCRRRKTPRSRSPH